MPPTQRLEEVPVEGQLWEGSGLRPVGWGKDLESPCPELLPPLSQDPGISPSTGVYWGRSAPVQSGARAEDEHWGGRGEGPASSSVPGIYPLRNQNFQPLRCPRGLGHLLGWPSPHSSSPRKPACP